MHVPDPIRVAPPEYVIVRKLEYFREGGSSKHLRDIAGILATTEVDRAEVERWVIPRGLADVWRAALSAS